MVPAGASQGPTSWFQLRLDVDLVIDADAPHDPVYVSASTQEQTCAQIKITRVDDRNVLVDSLDLVNGVIKDEQRANHVRIRFHNYLRDAGVVAGTNDLQVVLEQPPNLPVERAILRSTSGLIWNHDSPYDIEFTLQVDSTQIFTGEPLDVPYLIYNNDAQPARAMKLRVVVDSPDLKTVAVDDRPLAEGAWVDLGDVSTNRRGVVRLLPTQAGAFQAVVFLRGEQDNDAAVAVLEVNVADRPDRLDYVRFAIPGAGLIATGVLLYCVRWTRQRAGRQRLK